MISSHLFEMPHTYFETDPMKCPNCSALIDGFDSKIEKLSMLKKPSLKIAMFNYLNGRTGTVCPKCNARLIVNMKNHTANIIQKSKNSQREKIINDFSIAHKKGKSKEFALSLNNSQLADIIIPSELTKDQKSSVVLHEKKTMSTFLRELNNKITF